MARVLLHDSSNQATAVDARLSLTCVCACASDQLARRVGSFFGRSLVAAVKGMRRLTGLYLAPDVVAVAPANPPGIPSHPAKVTASSSHVYYVQYYLLPTARVGCLVKHAAQVQARPRSLTPPRPTCPVPSATAGSPWPSF